MLWAKGYIISNMFGPFLRFSSCFQTCFPEKVQLQLQLAVLRQDDTLRSTLRMLKDQNHGPAQGTNPKRPASLSGDES